MKYKLLIFLFVCFLITTLVDPDYGNLHLFCDEERFTVIDHYGDDRVYFDDGKEKLFIGYLTEYSLPGMRALFVEMPNEKRCMIGKVNSSGEYIEIRTKNSELYDRKRLPLYDGYFILPIAVDNLPVYEDISSFDNLVSDNKNWHDASENFDPPFSPYYYSIADIAEDYEWSRAKSKSASP